MAGTAGFAAATPACFIYYRIPLARRQAVVAAVREAQASLCTTLADLHAGLMQRADADHAHPGQLTLMEVYALPTGRAETAADWARLIEPRLQQALSGLVDPATRHLECFVPCA